MRLNILGFDYVVLAACVAFLFTPVSAFAAVCFTTGFSSPVTVADMNIAVGDTVGGNWEHAMPFVPTMDCMVSSASFSLKNPSGATDDIAVTFYADGGGVPGTSIGTGTSIDPAGVGASYSTIATPVFGVSLVSGTTYWVSLYSTRATTGSPYVSVGGVSSGGAGAKFDRSYLGDGWSGPWHDIDVEIDGTSGGGGGGGGASSTPPFVPASHATSTCTTSAGVTTCVYSYIPEITFLDFILVAMWLLFCASFLPLGYFFAGYKRPVIKHYD